MIGNLRPYLAYKDSDVPWLGKVPEHWDVRRLGQIGRLSKGIGGSKDDETQDGVPCIRYGDLYTTHEYFIKSSRSFVSVSKAQDYMPIKFGDVLFAASGETVDEIAKSAVNLLRTESCCGSDIILFRNERQMEARFLGYVMDCRASIIQKAMMGRGITIIHIYKSQLKRLVVCLPPLFEQTAIVRFLNHIDQYADHYIHTKQKLIKLLEEKKEAAIQYAITRGIESNVYRKSSGIEWLGEVPEHWNIAALRYRYQQSLGKMLNSSRITGEYLVPYLRNVDVQWDMINITSLPLMDIRPSEIDRYTVSAGDLLVCEGGETGRCALWDGSVEVCGYQKALHRLRPIVSDQDSARFLYYVFRLATNRGAFRDGQESTIAHLTGEKIRSHRFAFPPLEEQLGIVKILDNQIKKINKLIEFERRLIDLVREYRTRLISDVVTGKLDVREAAAQLPKQLSETGSGDAAHAPPHMSTGSNRDSDASTEEDAP